MRKIIIAIDGYSACGKSTTAREVAKLLNYIHIDSGAMYRAVALYLLDNHIPYDSPIEKIKEALSNIRLSFKLDKKTRKAEIFMNGKKIEKRIRGMEVSAIVSEVSAIREVREELVRQQREIGKEKGIVMDGRDIGSVVFPNAELKIFMNASLDKRVERRQEELVRKGVETPIEEVKKNLLHRDHLDSTRAESPLTIADDALILDTSNKTIYDQVKIVFDQAHRVSGENYVVNQ